MAPCFFWINTEQEQFTVSAGLSVRPAAWDAQQMRVRLDKGQPFAIHLNKNIAWAFKVIETINDEHLENPKNKKQVRSQFKKLINKFSHSIQGNPKGIFEYFERHMQRNKGIKSDSHIRSYKRTSDHLRAFDPMLEPSDITLTFWTDFVGLR